MNSSQPLLPINTPTDNSYNCREETVKLCFDGKQDYCSGFFLRSGSCLIIGLPITLLNIAYTSAGNTDGQWISFIGLAIGVTQVAMGIFCEYIHKPFKTQHCGYSCFNHFNLLAGSMMGVINVGLLIYQYAEDG